MPGWRTGPPGSAASPAWEDTGCTESAASLGPRRVARGRACSPLPERGSGGAAAPRCDLPPCPGVESSRAADTYPAGARGGGVQPRVRRAGSGR